MTQHRARIALQAATLAAAAALLLVGQPSSATGSAAQPPWVAAGGPDLPVRISVARTNSRSPHLLTSPDPRLHLIVDRTFLYLGAHRFVLRATADVEQHVFLQTTGSRFMSLLWVQVERLLPAAAGTYGYAADRPLTLWERPFALNVRQFTAPPDADSDRRRAWDLVERAGHAVPARTNRLRLVHLPDDTRRQELMLVYVEPAADNAPPASADALLERAQRAVRVE